MPCAERNTRRIERGAAWEKKMSQTTTADEKANREAVDRRTGQQEWKVTSDAGAVGVLLMPVWAAIGAMAATASGFTIVVERPPVGSSDKKSTDL